MLKNTDNGVQSKDVFNTSEIVVNLRAYSNVLQKAFKSKCNKVVGSRKKSAKTTISTFLGIVTHLEEESETLTVFSEELNCLKDRRIWKRCTKRAVQMSGTAPGGEWLYFKIYRLKNRLVRPARTIEISRPTTS